MTILSIISMVLTVAGVLLKYLISRNDSTSVLAQSALTQVTAANDRITQALKARRAVAVDNATGGLRNDDGFRRD